MRQFERSALQWPLSARLSKSLAVAAIAIAGVACGGGSTPTANPSPGQVGGSLTVWVDAVRLPDAKAYASAHPNVNMNIVTFDGDGNGATTMQTKIQLWNRSGSGWPDVVFSEQVNDPVWMAQSPFNFAAQLNNGLIQQSILSQWPAPSTAQCTINGKLYCVQDNIAQVVLWVNKKLMDQFGYTVPTTWQQWAALGQKVATEHPGYVIGNIGDSYGHWIYLWGDQCPLEELQGGKLLINSTDVHCTRMASLADPLIKNGTLPPLSVFTPDFAAKYGGANDKVLMMPGPTWYAKDVFNGTLHIPAGQMTAAMPLQWESESPITTGQVGGGPWIISKHSTNLATAADFVTWSTTVFNDNRAGYPAYAPLAATWLASLGSDPYFASDPTPAMKGASGLIWQGWSLVTYPDQPVWSNSVVNQLVAGQSLSSLLPALGDALAQNAQAAGYQVIRH